MARGKHDDEIEFGSDSFLDVVANIVGILIILIVVAGIKASAAPASAERIVEYLRNHPVLGAPKKTASGTSENGPQILAPSPDLVRRSQDLKARLAALDAALARTKQQTEETAHQEEAAERRIAELKSTVETESAGLGDQKEKIAEAEGRLEKEKRAVIQLEVDVQSAEKVKPTIKMLRHQLTPLGHDIEGKELHFRLMNDRVVYLPIDELMQRLRPEVGHQRQRLMREGIVRGEVGPVDGFLMVFTIQLQRTSAVDELRLFGTPTIGSDWQLIPEPDVVGEGIDEALRDGSEFLRRVREADANTTITFWVYPDSFALYRRLQEFAHNQNMTVAARPLPSNIPITGSTHGSRSSGQ
jgi:hypothetical protein